jgi:general secretion pathway protein L
MLSATDRGFGIVGEFFRWWCAELLALLPERARRLSQPRGRLVLRLDRAASATLAFETPTRFSVLGELADSVDAAAADQVRAILQQASRVIPAARDSSRICLRLDPLSALTQTIHLPLAAERNLAEVVGYELDRYTPFRAEQVYHCYRILQRDKTAQRLAVEVTLVPKAAADEALAVAKGLGLTIGRVDVAAPSIEGGHSEDLRVPGANAESRRTNRLTRWLSMVAVILIVIVLALPYSATQRKAAVMVEEAAALRTQAQASEKLRDELRAIHAQQEFLVARKTRMPTMSDLLLEVTRLLPDDTWLTEFRVTETEIEMAGVTASASGLIALLEKSGVFRDTNLRSPVTTDPSNGLERFNIAAHIVEKPHR